MQVGGLMVFLVAFDSYQKDGTIRCIKARDFDYIWRSSILAFSIDPGSLEKEALLKGVIIIKGWASSFA